MILKAWILGQYIKLPHCLYSVPQIFISVLFFPLGFLYAGPKQQQQQQKPEITI